MRDTLKDIIMQIRAAWRYRWYALLLAWLTALAGWAYVITMPNTFESNARVYVDTDSILRPLLKGLAVQVDVEQKLELMTKSLLSRPNLEKVLHETDLDIKAKTPQERERIISALASDIQIVSPQKEYKKSSNLYTITYQNRSAKLAKDVVQAFLNIFVENTLGDTRKDSDVAQRFLQKKIDEYEEKLTAAENRLTEFKRKHIGMLPGQEGGVFNRLSAVKQQIEKAELERREARNKRNELRRQLEEINANIKNGSSTLNPIDVRILVLEKKLDKLLLRYTDEYPDVKQIRQTIAQLKKQKKEDKTGVSSLPVGQNKLLDELKLALGKAETELAGINVRVIEYKKRMRELKEQLKILPQIEAELKQLNRDYEINKKNYDALVASRESARISESADATGDGVKFKIIDPPKVPIVPVKPNRPLLIAAILVISLGLGGSLAFVLSQLNPVILDANALRKITGYPVFGTISRVWTSSLMTKRKLEIGAFSAIVLGLVVMSVAVLVLNSLAGNIGWLMELRGGQ